MLVINFTQNWVIGIFSERKYELSMKKFCNLINWICWMKYFQCQFFDLKMSTLNHKYSLLILYRCHIKCSWKLITSQRTLFAFAEWWAKISGCNVVESLMKIKLMCEDFHWQQLALIFMRTSLEYQYDLLYYLCFEIYLSCGSECFFNACHVFWSLL